MSRPISHDGRGCRSIVSPAAGWWSLPGAAALLALLLASPAFAEEQVKEPDAKADAVEAREQRGAAPPGSDQPARGVAAPPGSDQPVRSVAAPALPPPLAAPPAMSPARLRWMKQRCQVSAGVPAPDGATAVLDEGCDAVSGMSLDAPPAVLPLPPAPAITPAPPAGTVKPSADAALRLRGAELWGRLCATCHGSAGAGDGPASAWLRRRPRDLRSGDLRWRSTAQGALPVVEDLRRVVRRGVPGSAMPAFADRLDEFEIEALAAHLVSLIPRYSNEGPGRPLPLAADIPPATDELLSEGRVLFVRRGCAGCHGSARQREAHGGAPATRAWVGPFRSGPEVADLLRTITAGVGPMSSYGRLPLSERLRLAIYVRSLRRDRPWWYWFVDDRRERDWTP